MRSHFPLVTLFLILGGLAVTAGACGGDDSSPAIPGDDGGGGGDATSQDGAGDTAPMPSDFGIDTRPSNPTCVAPARPPSGVAVTWPRVFANAALSTPMMMRQIPGDPSRWFVAQRGGEIVSFAVATPQTVTTVLTVPTAANVSGEGGLLGFAFHPKFAQNGRVFFSYTPTDANVAGSQMRSVIARMDSADNGATFRNYIEIVAFDQTTASNHKGGSIAFGPDGFLYFGFGDGGGGGDTFVNGQNTNGYFAKIHRIDVDTAPAGGKTYVVPNGNPFKNGGGQDSTYAFGLRNPFRFSFDRVAGDLWIGDVGQNLWEEIDRVSAPGANFGWSCLEGTHDYASNDMARCPNARAGFVAPVFEYGHTGGASKAVIGGVVYRGSAAPQMIGSYIFADEVSGELWALQYDMMTNAWKSVQLNSQGPSGNWVQIAEDDAGEVYALDLSGKIYKLAAAALDGGTGTTFPDLLSKTGCFDPMNAKNPVAGAIPYTVNSPLWSDGAKKDRWLAIPDGKKIAIGTDGHLDLPIGSVLIKTFTVGGKRTETRLLARHDDGGWAGYTYEWNDAETDATLLPSSKSKPVGMQTWYFPSRSDCFECHSGAAQRTLGMELGQLNGDEIYPVTNRVSNQLKTLDHIGMFTSPLPGPVAQIVAYPTPTNAGPLEARAKSYLQANCAICHRPNGNGGGPMDLRFGTAFGDAKACNVAPDNGDFGIAGVHIVTPGNPSKSLVSIRPHALDAKRMPPIATHIVDDQGVMVLDQWIMSLTACPPATASDAGSQ